MFDPDTMSVREFCQLGKFSYTKAMRLVWAKAVPSVRIGRQIRLLRSDVERMLQACRTAADPSKALPGALSEQDLANLVTPSVKKAPSRAIPKSQRAVKQRGVA